MGRGFSRIMVDPTELSQHTLRDMGLSPEVEEALRDIQVELAMPIARDFCRCRRT